MDKNTYETYEYLPTNNSETESNHFFVVQDDGTFLINRQVQYVAQVEDIKGVLEGVQPCTVYDVTSQQFFVDVDNSTELISVSDQFVLPDGSNNLYTNSYLLQSVSSETTNPVEENVLENHLKQTSSHVDEETINQINKQPTNCTEITLSDEQYHMLEQKGWILLETNEKIFVLDTLGLHDITNNDKLIQKLKSEVQSNANLEINSGPVKIETVSSTLENIITQNVSSQQDTIEFAFGNDVIAKNKENKQEHLSFLVSEKKAKETIRQSLFDEKSSVSPSQNKPIFEELKSYKDGKRIKLKTSLTFKDIPDKIVLGKAANGKNIIAKVTKSKCGKIRNVFNINQKNVDSNMKTENSSNLRVISTKNAKPIQLTNVNLQETQFENLIQLLLHNTSETRHNVEDIAMAEAIISQLLLVPAFKPSIIEHNLIITKVLKKEDELGKFSNESRPILVTGRVTLLDGDNWRFEHLPNLLQTHMNEGLEMSTAYETKNQTENTIKDDNSLLHVHISETKHSDNIVRTSVTLNKRQIPNKISLDIRKRNPSTMYACGACAAIFQSENDLKVHQETHCLETDDILTIETDKINKPSGIYCVMESGKEKVYACMHCEHKFTRLSNCHRHVKTHLNPTKQETLDNESSNEQVDAQKQTEGMYKCKMCYSSYYHPSTLSKHIVTRHIKVSSNK